MDCATELKVPSNRLSNLFFCVSNCLADGSHKRKRTTMSDLLIISANNLLECILHVILKTRMFFFYEYSVQFLITISANYQKMKNLSLRCIRPDLDCPRLNFLLCVVDFPSHHTHNQTNPFLLLVQIVKLTSIGGGKKK